MIHRLRRKRWAEFSCCASAEEHVGWAPEFLFDRVRALRNLSRNRLRDRLASTMLEYTVVSNVVAKVPSVCLNIRYCAKALGIRLLFLSLIELRDSDIPKVVRDS